MSDARRRQAESWAARHLGWDDWSSEVISSDAGFRRYFRLTRDDHTRVVMDAPDAADDTGVFADIALRLRRCGIHVPEIQAHDARDGLMLLEDLGRSSYLSALDTDTADTLFEQAVTTLIRMQAGADTTGLPSYSEALLREELDLFTDWYLERHRGITPDARQRRDWEQVCDLLVRNMQRQPQVFVHRDYMPRNLLVSDPNPGIIDFQDAVVGPVTYDLVSLLRDCYIAWPEERIDAWIEDYLQRAARAGVDVGEAREFRRWFDLMGVQRHLKAIGIFARLNHRDGKPRYLEDIPRTWRYVRSVAGRHPELTPLTALADGIWRAVASLAAS